MDVKKGDTVWFHDYSGIRSGVVLDTMKGNTSTYMVACVKCSDGYKSIDIDSRKVWMSNQEAILSMSEKKQQEASTLLRDAAELFRMAGGMKEEKVVE